MTFSFFGLFEYCFLPCITKLMTSCSSWAFHVSVEVEVGRVISRTNSCLWVAHYIALALSFLPILTLYSILQSLHTTFVVACNLLLPTSHMDHIIVNKRTCATEAAMIELFNRESEVMRAFMLLCMLCTCFYISPSVSLPILLLPSFFVHFLSFIGISVIYFILQIYLFWFKVSSRTAPSSTFSFHVNYTFLMSPLMSLSQVTFRS